MVRLLSLLSLFVLPLSAETLLTESFETVPDGELPDGWVAETGEWAVQGGELRGVATDYLSKLILPLGEQENVAVEATVRFERVKNDARWLALMVRNPAGQPSPFLIFTHRFDRTKSNGTEIGFRTGGQKPGWSILRTAAAKVPPVLGEAHRLRVAVRGRRITGYIDERETTSGWLPSAVPAKGQVGLIVSDVTAVFDDLKIETLPPPGPEDVLPTGRPRPLIIGHRGFNAECPENTLISIKSGFDAGADAVEIDLRLTSDGQLVLLHDNTVDRTTNGQGKIADLTFEQARALDAGSWKDPKYADQRIPTFDEALDAAKGRGPLLLDLKCEGLLERIAEAVRAKGMADQVICCCWTPSAAEDARKYLPEAPACFLGSAPAAVPVDWLSGLLGHGLRAMSLNYQSLTPELVRAAHLKAMPVYAWTVNDPSLMELCCAMGVDGILTDDPPLALQSVSDR